MENKISKILDSLLVRVAFDLSKTDLRHSYLDHIALEILRDDSSMAYRLLSLRLNEWEMRDSAGYSLPHTGERIELIYNLRSQNTVRNHRFSAFIQDTWRQHTDVGLFVINGGVRFSYWSWNREPLLSPRLSVGFIPEANEQFTFRLATGIYYQSPFYKEFRDTVQASGSSYVKLNRNIKSQRSIQVVGAMDYQFRVWDRPFKFTSEVYYKALSNLIPYNINNVRLTYYGENCASGYAAGLDMKLFGEFIPGTDSWFTASIMRG